MNSLLQNSDKLKKLGKTTRPFPPISKLPQASYPYPSQGRWIFKLHAEYIMRNAMLDEAQAGIKTARRNINNLRYADDTTLYGKKWRRTKEPLDKSKSGEWKSWLKTQRSENYHLVWPITSWQINGETVETVSDFILLGSKITADGDCSHEIKRHLLIGRKAMTNLDSILKSRDITLQQRSV